MCTTPPRWLSIVLLTLLGLAFVFGLWHLAFASSIGKGDFVGYWSATYLLRNGQNPYDPQSMDRLQHVQMNTGIDATIMAWNPPTLFVFLLPLGWLSFPAAKFAWLAVNITILLVGCLALARLYLPHDHHKAFLLFVSFAIVFPPVLSAIHMGQVVFLVFLGLVACLAWVRKGQWFWAGAALILTTIKPHVVVLPVIYLLLYVLLERRYQALAGLVLAGAICTAVLFLFRPPWVQDLIGLMAIAPVHWATPTIGGSLSYWQVSEAGRFLIILLLPLPLLLLRYRSRIGIDLAVALLTLITVPTTFFGWSFDQIALLIPIAQVFGWLARSQERAFNTWMAVAIMLMLAINYLQRALDSNDVYYVWVPLFWWVIFGLCWNRFLRKPGAEAREMKPA